MSERIPLPFFQSAIAAACDRGTSADPNGWSQENPTWGHCAAAALVVQSYYGGELIRGSLKNDPHFSGMGSHYWNQLPHGEQVDLTHAQFGGTVPLLEDVRPRARHELLANENTAARFRELSFQTMRRLHPGNPLFEPISHPTFKWCYLEALKSPCQKMRFGAHIRDARGNIDLLRHNRHVEPLRSMCEPTCIRLGIQSRTESMLGACGHAEEFAMAAADDQGVALSLCTLTVVGVRMDGTPWLKDEPEHTCLRCATQMYQRGIGGIEVPVKNRFVVISATEALESARRYATGEKKTT